MDLAGAINRHLWHFVRQIGPGAATTRRMRNVCVSQRQQKGQKVAAFKAAPADFCVNYTNLRDILDILYMIVIVVVAG